MIPKNDPIINIGYTIEFAVATSTRIDVYPSCYRRLAQSNPKNDPIINMGYMREFEVATPTENRAYAT